MRIDHITTKGDLHGVWKALYGGSVFDFEEMNRSLLTFSPKFLG